MTRNEECRHAVLAFLAERPTLAHSPEAIRRRVNIDGHDFATDEIGAALAFLNTDGLSQTHYDSMGSTIYHQATADGIRRHERAQ